MEAAAKLRFLRQSPRKVRLVADSIRGLDVSRAVSELTFSPRNSAIALLKLLNSAVANAEHNFQLKKDNLFIKEIRVDQGPALKRWKPRAFGRASGIRKETSHVSLILAERKPSKEKTPDKNMTTKKVETAKIVNSLDEVKRTILDDEKDTPAKKTGEKSGFGGKGIGEKGKKRFFSRKSG